jgi:hypothetical protein
MNTLPVARPIAFATTLTWAVAALLAISSAAGLAFGPSGLYDAGASTFPALIGQDIVALLFGVPLLVGSALLAKRGSVRALMAWMGALFYVAYFWYFYVVGIKFGVLFVVHIALVSMSMYGALHLLFALDLGRLMAGIRPGAPNRLVGGFLMTTALAFAALWAGVIADRVVTGQPLDDVSRQVIAIDGVVLLPLMFFAGVWLWRREPLGFALAGMLLVKVAATFLTLVATTVVAWRWGQPADPVQTTMYVAGLLVAALMIGRYSGSLSHA